MRIDTIIVACYDSATIASFVFVSAVIAKGSQWNHLDFRSSMDSSSIAWIAFIAICLSCSITIITLHFLSISVLPRIVIMNPKKPQIVNLWFFSIHKHRKNGLICDELKTDGSVTEYRKYRNRAIGRRSCLLLSGQFLE